jgi:hydroxymethylpyrimidine pyrophosphatase-like HAD family hydrolase
MFRQAGTSIAMGQAVDEVQRAATFVTNSNDDDGWSTGLERYVLSNIQAETGMESGA